MAGVTEQKLAYLEKILDVYERQIDIEDARLYDVFRIGSLASPINVNRGTDEQNAHAVGLTTKKVM